MTHTKSLRKSSFHSFYLLQGYFRYTFTPPVLKGAKQNSWWLPRQLMRTRSHRLSDSLWSVSSLLSLQTAVKPLGSYHLTFSYRKFAQVLPWMKKNKEFFILLGPWEHTCNKGTGKTVFHTTVYRASAVFEHSEHFPLCASFTLAL